MTKGTKISSKIQTTKTPPPRHYISLQMENWLTRWIIITVHERTSFRLDDGTRI